MLQFKKVLSLNICQKFHNSQLKEELLSYDRIVNFTFLLGKTPFGSRSYLTNFTKEGSTSYKGELIELLGINGTNKTKIIPG